jgi:hypothetical protein
MIPMVNRETTDNVFMMIWFLTGGEIRKISFDGRVFSMDAGKEKQDEHRNSGINPICAHL